jgi:hypothetical protein
MARLPKNSLLFDQAIAVSALQTAITELWWNVECIKCRNCVFVGHRAKVFAFHPQGDGSSAPLFHLLSLFLRGLGEVTLGNWMSVRRALNKDEELKNQKG